MDHRADAESEGGEMSATYYASNIAAGKCGRCGKPRGVTKLKCCAKCTASAKKTAASYNGPVINDSFLVCCAGFGRHRTDCKAWGK